MEVDLAEALKLSPFKITQERSSEEILPRNTIVVLKQRRTIHTFHKHLAAILLRTLGPIFHHILPSHRM